MKRVILSAALAAMFAITGCSVHPLPEDYARKDTFDIVHAIRCEARQAILDHAPEMLFESAYLGFEFTFAISEQNNANLALTFTKMFSSGSFTLPFDASAVKDRASNRNFKIVEKFAELKKAHCGDYIEERKNLAYPITGSIGLAEVVRTYARLERMTNLAAGTAASSAMTPPLPTFADNLTFTTTLHAGAAPHLALSPVPRSFRLTDLTFGLSAQRIDGHTVNLAIARDNHLDPRERFKTRAASRYSYVNPVATNHIQEESGARERVLLELDRQRLLRFYERGLLVLP